MKRVDLSDDAEQDKFGTGKHGHTNGSPGVTPATTVDDDWLDHVQEELARTVEAVDLTPDGSSYAQVLRAIRSLIRSGAASSWRARSTAASVQVQGIACRERADGDELWAAVGTDGSARAFSSADGSTWTSRTVAGTAHNDVVWGGGGVDLFVSVGPSGDIATSSDAVTWTGRTSGTSDELRAVCWNGTKFYACGGTTGTILESSDGINWSAITGAGSTPNDIAVSSDGQTIVAVGDGGSIWVTVDGGSNWLNEGTAGTDWEAVAYDGTTWVVAGQSGQTMATTDPQDWPATATSSGSSQLNDVIWDGDALFLAVGNGGDIYTSSNGVDWTQRSSKTTLDLLSAATGYGAYMVGSDNDTILESHRHDA